MKQRLVQFSQRRVFRRVSPFQRARRRFAAYVAKDHPFFQGSMEQSADLVAYAFGFAIGMVGLAYACVPMYQALCKKFGWGGTTGVGEERRLRELLKFQDGRGSTAKNKRIMIRFECQVTPGMPWYFTPTQEYVVVRPGETALAFFTAYNDSDDPITGVSTYNVMPYNAAPYFQKVQCFCFEEQRLRGREKVDMPVLFYLEPSILDDPVLKDVYDLTLAYNFFEVIEEAGEVEWDDDDGPDVVVLPDHVMRAETEGPPVDGTYIHPDSYKRQILEEDDPLVKLIKAQRRTVDADEVRARQGTVGPTNAERIKRSILEQDRIKQKWADSNATGLLSSPKK